jgi:hypothetical protein
MKITILLFVLFPLFSLGQYVGGSGDGYHSAAVYVSLTSSLNISLENSFSGIDYLFPNPTTDIINIRSNYNKQFTYCINNSLGSIVSSGQGYNQVNVSKLPSGTYFLILIGKNSRKLATTKFLKK